RGLASHQVPEASGPSVQEAAAVPLAIAPLPAAPPVVAVEATAVPAVLATSAPPLPPIAAPAQPSVPPPRGAGLLLVRSRKGQSVTVIDPASGTQLRRIDVGAPIVNLAVTPNGQTLWAFDDNPGEGDFQIVDLVKGERQGSKRLRNGPRAAAFSSDG